MTKPLGWEWSDNPGEGHIACTDCPAGRMASQNMSKCDYCPAGKYSSYDVFQRKLESQVWVPNGDIPSGQREKGCHDCPAGRHHERAGLHLGNARAWDNFYLEFANEKMCKVCDSGKYTASHGTTQCTDCEKGRYAVAGTPTPLCFECNFGQHQPEKGKNMCIQCTAGKYAKGRGNLACKVCPGGRFGVYAGTNECFLSAKGTYIPDPGNCSDNTIAGEADCIANGSCSNGIAHETKNSCEATGHKCIDICTGKTNKQNCENVDACTFNDGTQKCQQKSSLACTNVDLEKSCDDICETVELHGLGIKIVKPGRGCEAGNLHFFFTNGGRCDPHMTGFYGVDALGGVNSITLTWIGTCDESKLPSVSIGRPGSCDEIPELIVESDKNRCESAGACVYENSKCKQRSTKVNCEFLFSTFPNQTKGECESIGNPTANAATQRCTLTTANVGEDAAAQICSNFARLTWTGVAVGKDYAVHQTKIEVKTNPINFFQVGQKVYNSVDEELGILKSVTQANGNQAAFLEFEGVGTLKQLKDGDILYSPSKTRCEYQQRLTWTSTNTWTPAATGYIAAQHMGVRVWVKKYQNENGDGSCGAGAITISGTCSSKAPTFSYIVKDDGVNTVNIIDGGSGCTAGDITFGGGNCTNAPTGKYYVNGSGAVVLVEISMKGNGCTATKVEFTDTANACTRLPEATYSVDGNGKISSINMIQGGNCTKVPHTILKGNTCNATVTVDQNVNGHFCAIGKYANQMGMTECKNCSAGQFMDVVAAHGCHRCLPGHFQSKQGEAKCEDCVAGKYAPGRGSTHCADCGPGRFGTTTKQIECELCSAGHASDVTGLVAISCPACNAGTFANNRGESKCKACPGGQYTASQGSQACTTCHNGRYIHEPIGNCIDKNYKELKITLKASGENYKAGELEFRGFSCQPNHQPKGNFTVDQNGGIRDINLIYSGRCSGDLGSITFQYSRCSIASKSSKTECDQAQGTWKEGTGLQFSQKFVNLHYAIGIETECETSCTDLSIGKNQGNCTGEYCANPAVTPDFSNAQNDREQKKRICTDANGSWIHRAWAERTFTASCSKKEKLTKVACEDDGNTWTFPLYGAQKCRACPEGRFQNARGQIECILCAKGRKGPLKGLTSCSNCEQGHFSSVVGSVTCGACAAGKFAKGSENSECKDCEPGYVGHTHAQAECNYCNPGHANPNKGLAGHTCPACVPGKAAPEKAALKCEDCAAGRYYKVPGGIICIACAKGFALPSTGGQVCDACQAGFFSDVEASLSCKACLKGQFYEGKGAHACHKCTSGEYQPRTAQTDCLDCAKGYYQSEEGKSVCIECDLGTFAPETGRVLCTDCAGGKFAEKKASTECERCVRGRSSKTKAKKCDECLPGRFASVEAMSECRWCGGGEFQSNVGATSCISCIAGRASPPISVNHQSNSTEVMILTKSGGEKTSHHTIKATCSVCLPWEWAYPGSSYCTNCFTSEQWYGLRRPTQCVILWYGLGALIIFPLVLKLLYRLGFFGCICRKCCGLSWCDGSDSSNQHNIIRIRTRGSTKRSSKKKRSRRKRQSDSSKSENPIVLSRIYTSSSETSYLDRIDNGLEGISDEVGFITKNALSSKNRIARKFTSSSELSEGTNIEKVDKALEGFSMNPVANLNDFSTSQNEQRGGNQVVVQLSKVRSEQKMDTETMEDNSTAENDSSIDVEKPLSVTAVALADRETITRHL
eukprot:g3927.t1